MATRGRKAGQTFQNGYSKAKIIATVPAIAALQTTHYWRIFKAVNKAPDEIKVLGDKAQLVYNVRPSAAECFCKRLRTVSMAGLGFRLKAEIAEMPLAA